MPNDERTCLLPPGFGARHNPRLVFSTTATAWLAWASFLLAGAFSLFTSPGPALVTAWSFASAAALLAAGQFYVLRYRGVARVWRHGGHYDASVLSVRNESGASEVRLRFTDRDGVIRLIKLEMSDEDATRLSTDTSLHVAFLEGQVTYHYLPKQEEQDRELAM